jgi:hypothetical protein
MFPEQPERTGCTSSLCAFASLREIFGSLIHLQRAAP